jgi:DNA-binding CsgD family transcriptional regulator
MPSYVRGGRPRELTDAEIVSLYVEQKLDSDSVGARARCSGTTVLNLVRAAGHPIRSAGGRRKSTLPIPESKVIELYLAGQSGPQIAASAGCTPSSVYRVLRRAGVPIRDSASAGLLAERLRTRRRNPADG